MDADSWAARLCSASSKQRSQSALPSPSEHRIPVDAKNGVCPVCEMGVGVDMVAHISLWKYFQDLFHLPERKKQREPFFNYARIRLAGAGKSRKGGSHSTLSLLRKELQEGNLQSLLGGLTTSSNAAPDPLLSSFILPLADDYVNVQPHLSPESSSVKSSSSKDKLSERSIPSPALSVQEKEEKAKQCAFVQGLLMSTILEDNL